MARSHRLKSRRKKSPSKMGRKWTYDDLQAYNIRIVHEDLETFFGVTDLPTPILENDPRTAHEVARTAETWTNYLLRNSNRPKADPDNTESYTISFVLDLFRQLPHTGVAFNRNAMMRHPLSYLEIPGKPPVLDYCLRDNSGAVVLVVRVVRSFRGFEPEPRIISDAVAAFHNDNIMRTKTLGTDAVTEKVMSGIVMDGTVPSFYKIPVTAGLVKSIMSGERPDEETIVHAYRPELPTPGKGMEAPDNRTVLLSCLEAFEK